MNRDMLATEREGKGKRIRSGRYGGLVTEILPGSIVYFAEIGALGAFGEVAYRCPPPGEGWFVRLSTGLWGYSDEDVVRGIEAAAQRPRRSGGTAQAGADEIEALRRWKAEATEVIEAWERVWDALGQPGALGESKAAASLAQVARLRAACGA